MRALSIRQPFAELILQGIKQIEYRTQNVTKMLGKRFWIYASKKKCPVVSGQWSVKFADNIVVPTEKLPDWMIELAEQVKMIEPGTILPTGVIVGSAVIEKVEEIAVQHRATKRQSDEATKGPEARFSPPSLSRFVATSLPPMYAWHLTDIQRANILRKPRKHPQPVWFKPF